MPHPGPQADAAGDNSDADTNANAGPDALAALLAGIADAHPDRVAAWIRNEPGHWGFFAGQAVLAVRRLLGRRLEEPERRFVWHQMWLILQERRRQAER